MGSLFSKKDREELKRRIIKLEVNDPTCFGTLTPQKAVCHLIDSVLEAIDGDLEKTFKPSFYSSKLGQWLIISSPLPWPKGKIKIPEELEKIFFKTKISEDFNQDKQKLIESLELFATKEKDSLPPHPTFGNLSTKQWSALTHRHINHHLTQFNR